jgi:AcrR family transcriptional regulator
MTSRATVDWTTGQPGAAGTGAVGLRERKKAMMRQRLSDVATEMFLARGFAAVRVTEIAAACDVSEKTVYNYFPTKESLVLDRWEGTAAALQARLGDADLDPVEAVLDILAGELGALTSWLDSQDDTAAAIRSVRQFAEMIAQTPALRAYQDDTLTELVVMTSGLLARRAGLAADDPEPLIAANALLGLWAVHFSALKKHLDAGGTTAELYQAVTAEVEAAARLLSVGLEGFAVGPAAAARGRS